MRKRSYANFAYLTLFLAFASIHVVFAQASRETLTNAKIIEMVRLGLGETLIVAKINRSDCQCDTSTAAITKLKVARVSDEIIMAMLNASPEGFSETQPKKSKSAEDQEEIAAEKPIQKTSVVTAGPKALSQIREPGIYLFENGEMKGIEPSVFSGGKINPLMSTLTYGIKKTKWRAKVRGKSANLQTSNSQPVFYFVFNPEYKNSGAAMAGNMWLGLPATSPNDSSWFK